MARNPKNLTAASIAKEIASRLDGMEALFDGPIEDQDDDFEIDQTHVLLEDTIVLQGITTDYRGIRIVLTVGDIQIEETEERE